MVFKRSQLAMLVCSIVIVLLVSSCGPLGQAGFIYDEGVPEGYSAPFNDDGTMILDGSVVESDDSYAISVTVNQQEGIIYNKLYVTKKSPTNELVWESVDLIGNPILEKGVDSGWLQGLASATILLSKDDYNNGAFNGGDFYFLAYSCSPDGDSWDCANEKWKINYINLNTAEDLSTSTAQGDVDIDATPVTPDVEVFVAEDVVEPVVLKGGGESCVSFNECLSNSCVSPGVCTEPAQVCGNNQCETNENFNSCPQDCGEAGPDTPVLMHSLALDPTDGSSFIDVAVSDNADIFVTFAGQLPSISVWMYDSSFNKKYSYSLNDESRFTGGPKEFSETSRQITLQPDMMLDMFVARDGVLHTAGKITDNNQKQGFSYGAPRWVDFFHMSFSTDNFLKFKKAFSLDSSQTEYGVNSLIFSTSPSLDLLTGTDTDGEFIYSAGCASNHPWLFKYDESTLAMVKERPLREFSSDLNERDYFGTTDEMWDALGDNPSLRSCPGPITVLNNGNVVIALSLNKRIGRPQYNVAPTQTNQNVLAVYSPELELLHDFSISEIPTPVGSMLHPYFNVLVNDEDDNIYYGSQPYNGYSGLSSKLYKLSSNLELLKEVDASCSVESNPKSNSLSGQVMSVATDYHGHIYVLVSVGEMFLPEDDLQNLTYNERSHNCLITYDYDLNKKSVVVFKDYFESQVKSAEEMLEWPPTVVNGVKSYEKGDKKFKSFAWPQYAKIRKDGYFIPRDIVVDKDGTLIVVGSFKSAWIARFGAEAPPGGAVFETGDEIIDVAKIRRENS